MLSEQVPDLPWADPLARHYPVHMIDETYIVYLGTLEHEAAAFLLLPRGTPCIRVNHSCIGDSSRDTIYLYLYVRPSQTVSSPSSLFLIGLEIMNVGEISPLMLPMAIGDGPRHLSFESTCSACLPSPSRCSTEHLEFGIRSSEVGPRNRIHCWTSCCRNLKIRRRPSKSEDNSWRKTAAPIHVATTSRLTKQTPFQYLSLIWLRGSLSQHFSCFSYTYCATNMVGALQCYLGHGWQRTQVCGDGRTSAVEKHIREQ